MQACPTVQVLMHIKGKPAQYIEMHYLTSKGVFRLFGYKFPENLRYGTDEWSTLVNPTKDNIMDNELVDIYKDIVKNERDLSYSVKVIKAYQKKKSLEKDFKCRK